MVGFIIQLDKAGLEMIFNETLTLDNVHAVSAWRSWCLRCGVVIWVMLWLFSVLVESRVFVAVRGFPCVEFGTSAGSITFETRGVTAYSKVACYGHFMWRWHESSLKEYPADLIGEFGHFSIRDRFSIVLGLPVLLLLWIMLMAAWMKGLSRTSWAEFRSNGHMIAKFSILILLPLVLCASHQKWQTVSEAKHCYLTMSHIQSAADGFLHIGRMKTGEQTPWAEIFRDYLSPEYRKCPSGTDYILSHQVPRAFGKIVECQNPEHLRRMKIHDVKYWHE